MCDSRQEPLDSWTAEQARQLCTCAADSRCGFDQQGTSKVMCKCAEPGHICDVYGTGTVNAPESPTFKCTDKKDNDCSSADQAELLLLNVEKSFDTEAGKTLHYLQCGGEPARTVSMKIDAIKMGGVYSLNFPSLSGNLLVEVKVYSADGLCLPEPVKCFEVDSSSEVFLLELLLNHNYIVRIQGLNEVDAAGTVLFSMN